MPACVTVAAAESAICQAKSMVALGGLNGFVCWLQLPRKMGAEPTDAATNVEVVPSVLATRAGSGCVRSRHWTSRTDLLMEVGELDPALAKHEGEPAGSQHWAQISQEDVALVLEVVLFAAGQVPTHLVGTVATRRDALDSSRLYKSLPAIRTPSTTEDCSR